VFKVALFAALAIAGQAQAQATHTLVLDASQAGPVINRDIFGQFAEMLGEGIYGSVWVGPDSKIPNVRGIRSDVVQALRAIKVPVVRWPGGCYADQYHWRDGVGPATGRRARLNAFWGGTLEPNTFGTDEFMDFLGQIGSEAYLSVNVGSGTVQEAADWLEYMTADQPTALAQERAAGGHKAPYRVKYLGLGNESWGCGGPMTAEAYVERMKLFSGFVKDLNPAQVGNPLNPNPDAMRRIAVGPGDEKTAAYAEAVMKEWSTHTPYDRDIEGLSMHYYTLTGPYPMTDAATGFGEKEYAAFIKKTYGLDEAIAQQSAVMDKYDPDKKVSLVVDEWGNWLKPMPGAKVLKQQNSLRDAITASLSLDIFARHADRVRMANIAQMVNVIQSMVLTDGPRMVLTPTYYVFRMYAPFQDAQVIPLKLDPGEYRFGEITTPQVDGIAARAKDGKVWLALTNIDPNRSVEVDATVQGVHAQRAVGEVLTAQAVDAVNTFDAPATITPKAYGAEATNDRLTLRLPPKSVVVVRLDP
jgi:alpha-N-arabinofuranosidase